MSSSAHTDTASVIIAKPADEVFAFMSSADKLDLWSFGTWQIRIHENGLVQGKTLQDGSTVWVKIESHSDQRLIDYHVGTSKHELTPRIFCRVLPGTSFNADFNADSDHCMLLMTALRTPDMSDERWSNLSALHCVETGIIKSLIESGHDHRQPATW